MLDLWNFHDSWYLAQHNWFWLLVSLGIGVIVGWMTGEPDKS
jgi:hypothetical protein